MPRLPLTTASFRHNQKNYQQTKKVYTVYQSMTRVVHGHLCYKNRILVCVCVVKEVSELFLNEDDTARVGYILIHMTIILIQMLVSISLRRRLILIYELLFGMWYLL